MNIVEDYILNLSLTVKKLLKDMDLLEKYLVIQSINSNIISVIYLEKALMNGFWKMIWKKSILGLELLSIQFAVISDES